MLYNTSYLYIAGMVIQRASISILLQRPKKGLEQTSIMG